MLKSLKLFYEMCIFLLILSQKGHFHSNSVLYNFHLISNFSLKPYHYKKRKEKLFLNENHKKKSKDLRKEKYSPIKFKFIHDGGFASL